MLLLEVPSLMVTASVYKFDAGSKKIYEDDMVLSVLLAMGLVIGNNCGPLHVPSLAHTLMEVMEVLPLILPFDALNNLTIFPLMLSK